MNASTFKIQPRSRKQNDNEKNIRNKLKRLYTEKKYGKFSNNIMEFFPMPL